MSPSPEGSRASMVACGVVLIVAGTLVAGGHVRLAAPLLLLGLGMATALMWRSRPRG